MEKNQNGYSGWGSTPPKTPGQTSGGGAVDAPDFSEYVMPGVSCPGTDSCRPGGRQLAMVYTPEQAFCGLYSPEEAMTHGTLFEELDKPLCVEGKR